ncbi:SGNH/GDSL hydrolase family protein [Streptomyces sediminimaris]|uniref:SGNH/GDSL hydrolase family protein n=1 Tax=Streptomyces sediminimaris TaxID=3383721 RepID=UPI00399A4D92
MNLNTVSSPHRWRHAHRAALASAAALFALTACGAPGPGTGGATTATGTAGDRRASGTRAGEDAKPRRLLWMGDSIATAQAPALDAAMKAGGARFASMAAIGGGGVIGGIAASTWQKLPHELRSFTPDVVAYQITTYDWGTLAEQRAGYERLARTVHEAGADLLIVSAPPFKVDDFYKPHAEAIRTAPEAAAQVAHRHPATVRFLDASALWGTDAAAGKAQRSKDGIHSCQQGSAAFAAWFARQVHRRYGFTPAPVDQWATGSWTGDKVYASLGCR